MIALINCQCAMSLWVKEKYRGLGASGSRGHPSEKRSNCIGKLIITKKSIITVTIVAVQSTTGTVCLCMEHYL